MAGLLSIVPNGTRNHREWSRRTLLHRGLPSLLLVREHDVHFFECGFVHRAGDFEALSLLIFFDCSTGVGVEFAGLCACVKTARLEDALGLFDLFFGSAKQIGLFEVF